jgi:outer membrane autotransporter protein
MDLTGGGLGASLEAGYPIWSTRRLMFQPQVQIICQEFDFDRQEDAFSKVSFSGDDSMRGRVGFRLARTWALTEDLDGSSRLLTIAFTGDAWREFLGYSWTTFSALDGSNPQSFRSDLGGSWGELGGDATVQLGRHLSLYGNSQYSRGFDANRSAWTGSLGLRVNW